MKRNHSYSASVCLSRPAPTSSDNRPVCSPLRSPTSPPTARQLRPHEVQHQLVLRWVEVEVEHAARAVPRCFLLAGAQIHLLLHSSLGPSPALGVNRRGRRVTRATAKETAAVARYVRASKSDQPEAPVRSAATDTGSQTRVHLLLPQLPRRLH